jgi:hypothetical protein
LRTRETNPVWTEARRRRLRRLLRAGRPIEQAAAALGVTEGAARLQAWRMRVTVRPRNKFAMQPQTVPSSGLREQARRRGLSTGTLIERVVKVLNTEPSLVSAILDDGDGDGGR